MFLLSEHHVKEEAIQAARNVELLLTGEDGLRGSPRWTGKQEEQKNGIFDTARLRVRCPPSFVVSSVFVFVFSPSSSGVFLIRNSLSRESIVSLYYYRNPDIRVPRLSVRVV
ncbi:hypothetical protein NDU88_004766 [Pleurodeles waltl]|uniref:Uncharacterized protein n=1 Tax=Pleurodeles waltl TaxID=8319 RepID=A0AAV7WWT6_PLEWA|nr:hypothetical protein NDU88_004766 [Pleurodeles waltl]